MNVNSGQLFNRKKIFDKFMCKMYMLFEIKKKRFIKLGVFNEFSCNHATFLNWFFKDYLFNNYNKGVKSFAFSLFLNYLMIECDFYYYS